MLVAHDVCCGLDLGANYEIRRLIRKFADSGGAVMLISSDLDELLEMCGRLLVLSRGRLTETADNEHSAERLGLLMAGARA
ncbi:MAG: hypothetical protein ACREQ4_10915 [Candidatus Binataceae bacterium]